MTKWYPGTSTIIKILRTVVKNQGFAILSWSRLQSVIWDPLGLRFGTLLAFKMPPRPPQECPRHAQERPRGLQDRPNCTRTAPRAPKKHPRAPKTLPRGLQNLPRRNLLSRLLSSHLPKSDSKHAPLPRCFLPLRCAAVLAKRLTIRRTPSGVHRRFKS